MTIALMSNGMSAGREWLAASPLLPESACSVRRFLLPLAGLGAVGILIKAAV